MPGSRTNNKKVLLGMSGGLDSTMSALLLKNAGYTVIGLTLKTWHIDPTMQDDTINNARELAMELGIEHHVSDIEEQFKQQVVDYFCREYLQGRTPNPCNRCNPLIKWPALIKKANELNCLHVATGHYIQKELIGNKWFIKKGADPQKDQSYFLWNLDEEVLNKALFPLGKYTKEQVRDLARKNGLQETARKKESMGVCFLGQTNYRDFLKTKVHDGTFSIKPGNISDQQGNILGQHPGLPFFTIGQKKGLDLDDPAYFVTRMDALTNQIVVSKTDSLETHSHKLTDFHIAKPLRDNETVEVSIRIRGLDKVPEIPGRIMMQRNKLLVFFDKPAWAVTPGQSIVFYQYDCIIGGGIWGI